MTDPTQPEPVALRERLRVRNVLRPETFVGRMVALKPLAAFLEDGELHEHQAEAAKLARSLASNARERAARLEVAARVLEGTLSMQAGMKAITHHHQQSDD